MPTITKLTHKDETVLNTLLKNKKKEDFTLLYYSEWDKWSLNILDGLNEWLDKNENSKEKLYLISSWELPHAFAAFSITSTPSIVKSNKGSLNVMVEYSQVFNYFKVADTKKSSLK